MTAPFPYGIEVEVERGSTSNFGDKSYAPAGTIAGCAFDPGKSIEENEGRTTVIDRPRLLGPFGADLRPDDRVIVPGPEPIAQRRYKVVGRVRQWRNPFNGWSPGFECDLEAVS